MPVYFLMIAVSALLAAYSLKVHECYSIKLNKSGKIITLKQRNMLVVLSFIPVFLVSALRYEVGVDYHSYAWMFDAVKQGQAIHAEMGYKFLNQLVLLYSNNSQSIFIVTSAITLTLIFYGIYKYSPNPALSIFLLVTMGYLFSSFNILRQYIAIALIFASLRFIKENKFLPFLLIVLLAMTFHKTAIIMIPMFFITQLRLKQSYMLIISIVGACFIPLRGVMTNLLVSLFYPQYAGTDLIQPLSGFEFVYYALVFGLAVSMCFMYKKTFFEDKYNLIVFNCVFYSFLIYLCFSFVPEINRIAVYLEFFVILLIPRIFAQEQNKKTKRLYYFITIVGFTAFLIISVGVMQRYNVLPYQIAI